MTLEKPNRKSLRTHERELRRNNFVIVNIKEEDHSDLETIKPLFTNKLTDNTDIWSKPKGLVEKIMTNPRLILIMLQDYASKMGIFSVLPRPF